MPHAMINGARLFFEETGAGEPIIFHHGYASSHDSWDGVASKLRDRFRCIVMDARGAGESEHTPDGYRITQFVDDVIGLADHLGIGQFTYCGHSLGGVMGMDLAARYPSRLTRLILVAPAPASGVEGPPENRERSRMLWKQQAREQLLFERMGMSARPQPIEAERQALERALSVAERYYDDCWTELVNFRGDLSRVTTPTLVVAGAADSLLQSNLLDFMRLPDATLHVFSRVAHGIPREVPAELAGVIADFCDHGVVTAAVLQQRLLEASPLTGGPLNIDR